MSTPKKAGSAGALGRPVRAWWKRNAADGEVLDGMTLAACVADVGVLALQVLAQRLSSPSVKMEEKVKIALVMAPRMIAETRGRPPKRGEEPAGTGAATSKGAAELLDAYNVVRMRTG